MDLPQGNSIPIVQDEEFKRLLGLPPDYELTENMVRLCQWARDWYAENGQPWIYFQEVENFAINEDHLTIESYPLYTKEFRKRLISGRAHSVILIAVGAGPEAEQEAQVQWQKEFPDNYFFMESYASAVVEALIAEASGQLCAWADTQGMAALPHYSPGYKGWELKDQRVIYQIISAKNPSISQKIELLSSGMLKPKKSQLAVFGLTRDLARAKNLQELVPCTYCSLLKCQFRRGKYRTLNAVTS